MPELRFGQIDLFCAICKAIERLGGKGFSMTTRQANAVIAAADGIMAELKRDYVPATAGMGLAAWLASDDVGMSSRWMARVLAEHEGISDGLNFGRAEIAHPLDADDFGRCVRLLDAVPELRQYIRRMADGNGPEWKALAGEWAALESLYREGKFADLSKRIGELRKAGSS